jgi:hypothetical protein
MAGGAGADPMKMAAARELAKLGNAMHRFMRAGKFQIKASENPASRKMRDTIKSHLTELMSSAR